MRTLEARFIAVCDEYLSSHSGYEIRGDQGLFSFAMIIWLGIRQRLSGYSLRSSLNDLASRTVDNGGIGFLVGRTNRNARISTNNGGLTRARERISVEDVRGLLQAATGRGVIGKIHGLRRILTCTRGAKTRRGSEQSESRQKTSTYAKASVDKQAACPP